VVVIHCRSAFRKSARRELVVVVALVCLVIAALLVTCQTQQGREAQAAAAAATHAVEAPDCAPADASSWPRFRGPQGSGIAPFRGLPLTWNARTGENIVWRTRLPLPGANSPVIWGKRVFVTGANASRREVYCLDAETGELLWATPVGEGCTGDLPHIHRMTGYAAPTGTTDGHFVYEVFPTGHVVALNFGGQPAWQRRSDMSEDIYGHASSLVLCRGLLLVQIDLGKPNIGLSHMAALDKHTGKTVWDIRRPVQGSWTTPIVIDIGKREELITSAKPWVIAYDPVSGREYWRLRCVEGDSAPSPIYANGQVYVANIYASLVAIRPGGEGNVTETHVSWSAGGALPDICSPLSDGELVFVLSTHGVFSCYDADDGRLLWSQGLRRRFRSSPSLVGDRVYLFSEQGESVVVAADREYRHLATGRLGEAIYSSPGFASGRMYVRGQQHLFCIGSQ